MTSPDDPHRPKRYGFPASLWRAVDGHRPPGLDPRSWRSPLRGPWLTSVFAVVLLVTLPVVTLTGLLSYVAYGSQARPTDVGWLHLPLFDWPTDPSWLFRLNQGIHVVLGLVLIPIVLAKLWSVVPRLFAWPPARSVAEVLERMSLLMLVGGVLFELVTGVLNIQYDYVFGFSFYTAHYYGAWVFIVGFVSHVILKLPRMIESLRSRSFREVLRTRLADTRPEPRDEDGLVAVDPASPTISRRGALAMVGGGSVMIFALTAGQTIGGFARPLAVLLPRGRDSGDGPNDFPINRTADAAGISPAATGEQWRLTLSGGADDVELDRAALLALPSTRPSCRLPVSRAGRRLSRGPASGCGTWPDLAGVGAVDGADVSSLEESGAFNTSALNAGQASHEDALLALRVNDTDLSLDHGFPARIIVPAMPGVLNTKWVTAISFQSA